MDVKRKILISWIAGFLSMTALSQGYQVQAVVQGLPDGMVRLSAFYKTEYAPVDSVQSVNGAFYFYLDEYRTDGMYRIDFAGRGEVGQQKRYIEFVWAHESFGIYAQYNDLDESVSFEGSEENRLLGRFRAWEESYERKMSALFPLIDGYPEGDDFYTQAEDHFRELQEERNRMIRKLAGDHPGLYAARIIVSYLSPVIEPGLSGEERMAFLRDHYFELAPVDDPALLHAPVYSRKIIDYLRLYRGSDYSFSDQEEAFIEAVDMIMANVSGDPELRSFVVEYLLEGFESFGMERIQTYIVDTYVDETCETDVVELAVERVKGYREMEEGQVTKDILIRTADNEMVRLSEVDADYTLLVFWASYCEHCQEMIPELKEWYLEERPENVEVFAVSIDSVKADWEQYLLVHDLPWINAHEPMGWEGQSAEDYNIYATPTMFLLDRERMIIARPFNMRELRRTVRRLMR